MFGNRSGLFQRNLSVNSHFSFLLNLTDYYMWLNATTLKSLVTLWFLQGPSLYMCVFNYDHFQQTAG